MNEPRLTFDDYDQIAPASGRSRPRSQNLQTIWGRYDLPSGRTDRWLFHNLDLVITRSEHNWIVRSRHVLRAPEASKAQRYIALSEDILQSDVTNTRVGFSGSELFPARYQTLVVPAHSNQTASESVLFSPLFPEPQLFIKLRDPVILDPGESLEMRGHLPLEIRIDLLSQSSQTGRELSEVRVEPLADAWPASSQHDGELCVSLYRDFFQDRRDSNQSQNQFAQTVAPHHSSLAMATASQTVVLTNPTSATRIATHLLIPCSDLSLYHCPETGFWGSDLVVKPELAANGHVRDTWMGTPFDRVPRQAKNPRLITPARRARPQHERSTRTALTLRSLSSRLTSFLKDRG